MLCVAIETSTRAPSVAAQRGDARRATHLSGARQHASDLLPALAALIAELGSRPDEIELVVVGLGPGSYTGLRVGIATALGLARGANGPGGPGGSGAQLLGLPSTEALVWERCVPGERASVVLEARRGELYFARYERTADGVVARVPPCVQQPSELVIEPGETVFATPGLEVPALASMQTADPTPGAAALLELGLKRFEQSGPHAVADLEPLYLRAFSAKPR